MAQYAGQGWGAGTRVQVRNRFTQSWSSGFEVADERREGDVLVRRLSDNHVLPIAFPAAEIRPEN